MSRHRLPWVFLIWDFIVKCEDPFIALIDLQDMCFSQNHGLHIGIDQIPWYFKLFTEGIELSNAANESNQDDLPIGNVVQLGQLGSRS